VKLYYILDEQNRAVPVADVLTWGRWYEANNARRIVKQEQVGEFFVSTVFLGLDHAWGPSARPVLFETMVFPHDTVRDLHCERYSTWAEAATGHEAVVARLRAGTLFEPSDSGPRP
jgi:hypothetical protein